jgi:hypothetical protein
MTNNSIITLALFFLLAFPVTAIPQDQVCFYASKGFAADVTFQTHGATCQQCSTQAGGSWIDRRQGCEQVREKEIPGAQPLTKVCSDSDGLRYSEGAIFDNGSVCSRCQSGQWFGLDKKAFCKN